MAKSGFPLKKAYVRWRASWEAKWSSPVVKMASWMDLMVFDYGFLRPFFNRPRQIAPGVYRSNQPSPTGIRKLSKRGFKSILSLRKPEGSYHLWERHSCSRHDIELFNVPLKSRRLPTLEQLHELRAVFESAPRPLLIHCKSGADRAGFASVLYALLIESEQPEEALRHLSLRFLHFKEAKTGVLDYCFEEYISHWKKEPVPFLTWASVHYDPDRFKREFVPKSWANFIVDGVLRRE